MKPEIVAQFLGKDVPPGGTAEWTRWKEDARTLGAGAVELLLRALREGTDVEQRTALVALREHGYESWMDDSAERITYRVRKPPEASWILITPIAQPERLEPPHPGKRRRRCRV